jgi:valyl-tRNA synthetase
MTNINIDKTYRPDIIEQHWYQIWENKNYFSPSENQDGETFCIVLPPPNVTGSLHMGHGFGFTLIDVLIRYERMRGKKTLWQTGTDHAGIATQMVVERKLNQMGKTRNDLGRDEFIKAVWEWKEESGGNITRQLRRLGASMDWTRERFTMDEDLSYAVRHVFIQLYKEGLIYRGKRLVNWDPVLETALSDLEVINEEEPGKLWHIRYPVLGAEVENEYLVVATTRPETLFGDVAVAVHPDDERYQAYIGKQLHLPLTGQTIPVIADESVEISFGTGCVKITPAHDFNDYAIGAKHGLTPINILTPTAQLNDSVPEAYRNMDRFAARKQVIEDLHSQQLIDKITDHTIKIPRGDRSNAIIEPYLIDQWYVKSKPLAEAAILAVEKGETRFIPESWNKTFFQWMHNIEDWCISRQLWWGHRIPAWFDEENNVYVGHNEEEIRAEYNLSTDIKLTQDEDVLDTWFSSALWPFSSLGWPKATPEFETFFPTNILVTGFDIIFFWVARMMMMSLKFTGRVPFREVYITGLIRDAEGHKMSKSKGNVLDPIDLIDGIDLKALLEKRTYGLMQPAISKKIIDTTTKEFPDGISSSGTDALRFTFCSLASYTREIRFDTNRLGGYRNFCNKLWNAARYILMNVGSYQIDNTINMHLSLPDRWIRSLLQKTMQEAHAAFSQYRFDLLAQTLYDFTWNEFCDWYLELSKPILTSSHINKESEYGTKHTLIYVLDNLLRLLHPIMPFITEEIWQRLRPFTTHTESSIMLAAYPVSNSQFIDEEAMSELEWIKQIVIAVRTIRSEMNIAPGKLLPILLRKGTAKDKLYCDHHHLLMMSLAKIKSIDWLSADTNPPLSATAFVNELEIFIPMSDFIDKEAERERLNKEILKLEKEQEKIKIKLSNPQFIDKAPLDVVNKEKARQEEADVLLNKLKKQLEDLN